MGSWVGAGHPKDQAMIRSLELSAPPSILQREERGQKCLHDETFTEIPKVQGLESFWFAEHIRVVDGWCAPAPREQKLLPSGLSPTSPYVCLLPTLHLYPLSDPLLFNKLVNLSKRFPEFCELFQQIIKIQGRGRHGNLRFVVKSEVVDDLGASSL